MSKLQYTKFHNRKRKGKIMVEGIDFFKAKSVKSYTTNKFPQNYNKQLMIRFAYYFHDN